MEARFKKLLVPVESQVRELDAKLLFSCAAAERGFEVILGSRAHVHFYASRVKNCIYVAKSMRRFSDRMFKIMHELGHRVVVWDEEALVRLPDQEYHHHRLSPNTFKYIDHVFAWGKDDSYTYKNYHGYKQQPIHITGNPRIDVLRPELRDYFKPDVDVITNKYGNFILINTNFGQVNHFVPSVGKGEAKRDQKIDGKNRFMSERFHHKKTLLNHFKKMIILLAKSFPTTNFIVRPHPSESLEYWQEYTKDHKNIHTNNTGNVIPWIMAAKGLISNGCTTSIEAFLLQKPTMGYYPVMHEEIDDELPKIVCDISTTEESLRGKVEKILTGNYQQKSDCIDKLMKHIENINGDYAVDRISLILQKAYSEDFRISKNNMNRVKGVLHNELRTIVKYIKKFDSSSRNNTSYQKHRYPDIDENYLRERVTRYNKITHRFENIKINPVTNYLYSIQNQ